MMRSQRTIWLLIGSLILPSTSCNGFRLFNNGAQANEESSFHHFLRGERKVEEQSVTEDDNGILTASLTIRAQSSYPLQHSSWIDLEVVVLSGHCDSQLSILTVCTQSNENVFVSKTLLTNEPENPSDGVVDIAERRRVKGTHSIVQFNSSDSSSDDTATKSVGDRRFVVTKERNWTESA
mmetsp:Transcript_26908/g.38609  ORF Transcript_26908/g.38609 Transcript_26908/m.38609 type:complete len:180 (+) Transcript_26908:73-612(+)